MFGKEFGDYDKNNIEFVYAEFESARNIDPNWNPNYIGTIHWGAKGLGFGTVALYRMSDRKLFMDSEFEDKNFLRQLFMFMLENSVLEWETSERPEHYLQMKKE